MHHTSYTIERDGEEIDLEVEYTVAAFDPGCSYGPPEFCEPPSGGEVEELNAYRDGAAFPLTDAEREKVEAHIYDTHDYYEMAEPDLW